MNTPRILAIALAIASTQVLGGCASLGRLQSGDGVITTVGPQELRLCFHPGISLSPGQEVSFISSPDTPRPSYKSMRPAGRARITAAGTDGCATAVVLDGHPHQDDEVRLSDVHDGHGPSTE